VETAEITSKLHLKIQINLYILFELTHEYSSPTINKYNFTNTNQKPLWLDGISKTAFLCL